MLAKYSTQEKVRCVYYAAEGPRDRRCLLKTQETGLMMGVVSLASATGRVVGLRRYSNTREIQVVGEAFNACATHTRAR